VRSDHPVRRLDVRETPPRCKHWHLPRVFPAGAGPVNGARTPSRSGRSHKTFSVGNGPAIPTNDRDEGSSLRSPVPHPPGCVAQIQRQGVRNDLEIFDAGPSASREFEANSGLGGSMSWASGTGGGTWGGRVRVFAPVGASGPGEGDAAPPGRGPGGAGGRVPLGVPRDLATPLAGGGPRSHPDEPPCLLSRSPEADPTRRLSRRPTSYPRHAPQTPTPPATQVGDTGPRSTAPVVPTAAVLPKPKSVAEKRPGSAARSGRAGWGRGGGASVRQGHRYVRLPPRPGTGWNPAARVPSTPATDRIGRHRGNTETHNPPARGVRGDNTGGFLPTPLTARGAGG